MSIGDNLRNMRLENKMTQEEVAKKIGVTKQTLHKYEVGIITNIPLDKIEQLAKIYNVSPISITGWQDDTTDYTIDSLIEKQDNIWKIKAVRKVPVISEIACGNPIILNDDEQETIEVEDYIKGDFAFKARGDSMINAGINEGDLIFISKNRSVYNGDIVAVSIENEITLKTYRQKDNKLYFLPENSDYDPIIFKLEELEYTNINIIGVATHILKSLKRR